LARRLSDLRLDLAILREETVIPPLLSAPFARFRYTLFVPRRLAGPARTLPQWLPKVPMIAPPPGWTREQITRAATAAGIKFRIHVEGSSATIAVSALRQGTYAAILPSLAAQELAGMDVAAFQPKFLRDIERRLCIAWHPRMADARPIVEQAVEALRTLAAGTPRGKATDP
jgi:DNA-binding transcriptional LysR family regulator